MSETHFDLKDHPLLTIISIFGIGFGAAWFLAQEVLVKPSERVSELQTEISTLQSSIQDDKGTISELTQSLEQIEQEKQNVQILYDNTVIKLQQATKTFTEAESLNKHLQTQLEAFKNNQGTYEEQIRKLTTDLQTEKETRITQESLQREKEQAKIDELNKTWFSEKGALERQIRTLNAEVQAGKDAQIAQEALQGQKEKRLTDELNKECITKIALQQHRENEILTEIEKLKKECQNQQLVEEILQKYKREKSQ